jgi:dinuclear metal center YbgI/SA1388 family protein
MPQIQDVTRYLETIAPPAYQESYDNSGLIVGDSQAEVSGILVSLDAVESVVDEAIAKGCNLIVSHHPIVFRGLKSLTGKNYVERTVIKAIKNDVALYAIHTNLDNVQHGVNRRISDRIGLQNVRILAPKSDTLHKLVTFAPVADANRVLQALGEAGAGQIGNYKNCSFQTIGTGSFQPTEHAQPHIGESGKLERVEEQRIEVLYPAHLAPKVLAALCTAHPYEEVAYYQQALLNQNQEVGSGMIGELPTPVSGKEFLAHVKERMQLSIIRHTRLLDQPVHRVAVCGGAGSFLLPQALKQRADAFVTADFKYHEFFDADDQLMITDIGHYESEVFTKELLRDFLSEKFVNFAVHLAEANTNPIFYA